MNIDIVCSPQAFREIKVPLNNLNCPPHNLKLKIGYNRILLNIGIV